MFCVGARELVRDYSYVRLTCTALGVKGGGLMAKIDIESNSSAAMNQSGRQKIRKTEKL